eukprot:scaffold204_cov166-Alexandrium_tamarense.AAC.8
MGAEAQSSVVMDGWVIVLTVTVLLWSISGLGAKVRNGAKNSCDSLIFSVWGIPNKIVPARNVRTRKIQSGVRWCQRLPPSSPTSSVKEHGLHVLLLASISCLLSLPSG